VVDGEQVEQLGPPGRLGRAGESALV
jgi:hypothetical protein